MQLMLIILSLVHLTIERTNPYPDIGKILEIYISNIIWQRIQYLLIFKKKNW